MAKEKKTAKEAPAAATDAGASDDATPPKRSKKKLFAIGGAALALCLGGGGYFAVPVALAMFAPPGDASSGEAVSHEAAVLPEVLPGKKLVYPDHAASDYQIVSIYDGEAYLATSESIIRIEVGSTAPGLGDILAIEASDTGGTVKGTLATLKTS